MSHAPSLFGTPREWAIDLAVVTGVGVFLGVIGPFGSFYGGPIELRIAFWVVNMWVGFLILSVIVRLSVRASRRLDLPVWFALAMGVAVGAAPLSALIGLFSAHFWPGGHGRIDGAFALYGETLAMSEAVAFAFYFLSDRTWKAAAAPPAAPDPTPDPPVRETGASFLDRLPPRLGRELLCLQMEDHYVRAHTVRGSDLILIPLKDAIAELGGADGLQVHRSWWVARRAVVGSAASGRNLTLRLNNGLEVPVSRASVAKLRAAGWLDPI